MPPDAVVPPPILPAPDLPGDDPLIELPPAGRCSGSARGAGAAVDREWQRVFSFADLAEQLLDSVVYISTSQRVDISPTADTADASETADDTPTPPGEDFFDDFFDEDENGGRRPARPSSRSAPASSSMRPG